MKKVMCSALVQVQAPIIVDLDLESGDDEIYKTVKAALAEMIGIDEDDEEYKIFEIQCDKITINGKEVEA